MAGHFPSYWDLFDKHPNEPWSEELAWVAGQYSPFGDECDADCYLYMITAGPQQYWIRLPHGAHVAQALAKADERASEAIKDGVGEGAPTLPAIESVRKSLSAVTAPGKVHLLALLDELQKRSRRGALERRTTGYGEYCTRTLLGNAVTMSGVTLRHAANTYLAQAQAASPAWRCPRW